MSHQAQTLSSNIHTIIEDNPTIDLFWVPRINTVEGMTPEHARMWRYNVNEEGWINFPDWQGRIFKNRPNIRWEKKVHEMITGYKTYSTLPEDKPFCILHPKDVDKQTEQNNFYSRI